MIYCDTSFLLPDKIKAGTVDYWHVAFALVAGAEKFMTFDAAQLKLARTAGLDAPDLLRSGGVGPQ